MNKKTSFTFGITLLLVILCLSSVSLAFAVNTQPGMRGQNVEDSGVEEQSEATTTSQKENKNQIKTQNEGEDGQDASSPKKVSPRSEVAVQHMSNVAQMVEELLSAKTLKGGIGVEVREIAQEQKTSQEETRLEIEKVDSRKGILKSIIGPDFKALKNIQKQIEQNQLRIQQLEELKNQLTNQGDISQVQEMIEALTNQNVALQDIIRLEEQSGSLLGWLFRFIAK